MRPSLFVRSRVLVDQADTGDVKALRDEGDVYSKDPSYSRRNNTSWRGRQTTPRTQGDSPSTRTQSQYSLLHLFGVPVGKVHLEHPSSVGLRRPGYTWTRHAYVHTEVGSGR